jgi:hypothetical protein
MTTYGNANPTGLPGEPPTMPMTIASPLGIWPPDPSVSHPNAVSLGAT